MNNLDNLKSYDNVEFVQGHELSEQELRDYCMMKMESAKSNVEFLEQTVLKPGGGIKTPVNICEIGGGNGKLLYCLEKKELLKKGINYEVSKSRCELAQKFAQILSCNKVENINKNFLEVRPEKEIFDCIIMVDVVMQLISPLYDAAENDTIAWIKHSLKKGGYLFLEIEDYSKIIEGVCEDGVLRRWEEFPQEDPFQYMLQKMSVDIDGNLVVEKWFIRRNSSEREYFKNVIQSYTKQKIKELFSRNGFDVTIHLCEDDLLFQSGRSGNEIFRVIAKKL